MTISSRRIEDDDDGEEDDRAFSLLLSNREISSGRVSVVSKVLHLRISLELLMCTALLYHRVRFALFLFIQLKNTLEMKSTGNEIILDGRQLRQNKVIHKSIFF